VEIFGDTATVYRDFALEAYGSPCFRDWASSVAEDADVLGWLQTLPERKRQANLVFAAARWHGVPAPSPYAALRAALLGDGQSGGPIRRTILERATQTNEVGRLATLYPAFSSLAPNGPGQSLALLEVGASAGLCLYPDRYLIRWKFPSGGTQETDPVGPLLECATTGDIPPWALAPVVWRGGIDLSPVDVTDDDAVRWLEVMVWPEQEERRERLRAAVRIAREDPPYLVRGDLLDELPALVAQAPVQATLVVFHSAVIAYLEPADRERFATMMAGLVAEGQCHWVSNEGPRVLPAHVPPGVDVPLGRFVLAVDGHPVALTHGHGAELDWL
jgi:hypothetical protein